MMEWNDIYDSARRRTGRLHRRGDPWGEGEFGLVVCVWVYDGKGKLLLTRRAPEKSFAGTWENSGGAAKAGEDSLTAIVRELWEETGICRAPAEFEYLRTTQDAHTFYDHYCLKAEVPLSEVVLLPGETDDAKWVTFEQVHELIERGMICQIISQQFWEEEENLRRHSGI